MVFPSKRAAVLELGRKEGRKEERNVGGIGYFLAAAFAAAAARKG
jgi:hypothetical protein